MQQKEKDTLFGISFTSAARSLEECVEQMMAEKSFHDVSCYPVHYAQPITLQLVLTQNSLNKATTLSKASLNFAQKTIQVESTLETYELPPDND